MDDELITPDFSSVLARPLEQFLRDKRSRGCTYRREVFHLQQLDRFLVEAGLEEMELPRLLTEQWVAWTVNRKPSTHRKRIIVVRQFACFMRLHGLRAHIPPLPWTPRSELRSAARIFSREEMQALLDAADRLRSDPHTPLRHLVVPELFRVLYGCGLRAGEARRLRVVDVDLNSGTLSIHQGKFHRDRLVPVAPGLRYRLQRYAVALGERPSESPFSQHRRAGTMASKASTASSENCSKALALNTAGEAKVPGYTRFATPLQSIVSSSGIELERI